MKEDGEERIVPPYGGKKPQCSKTYYEYGCYLFLMKGIKEMKTMSTSMFHYVSKGCINKRKCIIL